MTTRTFQGLSVGFDLAVLGLSWLIYAPATTSGLPFPPAIKLMLEVMGEDRVMYAMDYPYEYVADEVRTHDLLDISDSAKKKLMQTNAERVFKL